MLGWKTLTSVFAFWGEFWCPGVGPDNDPACGCCPSAAPEPLSLRKKLMLVRPWLEKLPCSARSSSEQRSHHLPQPRGIASNGRSEILHVEHWVHRRGTKWALAMLSTQDRGNTQPRTCGTCLEQPARLAPDSEGFDPPKIILTVDCHPRSGDEGLSQRRSPQLRPLQAEGAALLQLVNAGQGTKPWWSWSSKFATSALKVACVYKPWAIEADTYLVCHTFKEYCGCGSIFLSDVLPF